MDNRLSDSTNVLRSHYYILKNKFNEFAIPLSINNKLVYLHKMYRGFSKHHFTHSDFMSIIRVLGFKYFNFKCTNIKNLINNAFDNDSLYTSVCLEDSNNNENSDIILNYDNIVLFSNEYKSYIDFENFFNIDKDHLKARNLWLYGKPSIEIVNSNNKFTFNYDKDVLNIVEFYNYIDSCFNSKVSSILQNPISSVYLQLSIAFDFYKITNNIQMFALDIFPSMYDYCITFSIFKYIEEIGN